MATPSEPVEAAIVGPDRRLHPLSWLFVLLQQLRMYALPIVVLLVTGRGNRYEFVGLYGAGLLVGVALARYVTYRYGLGPEGIVIRSGVLQTTRRDIPYERIHNVSLRQSLLHRWLGVADVRLESAGGAKAEAEMRVLSLADARALEEAIRERGARKGATAETAGARRAGAGETTLLAMQTADIVRLGLISNRGMVLVAAAIGTLSQVVPEEAIWPAAVDWISDRWVGDLAGRMPAWFLSRSGAVTVGVAAFVVAVLATVRVLSVVLAVLQFHGFRLDDAGGQLRVERGLLSRVRAYLPRRRIQAWRLRETVLHRWFGRQTLRVDSAGGGGDDDYRGVRELAPVATPTAIEALIRHVRARDDWPPRHWRPLHPQAWRRRIVVPGAVVGLMAGLLAWRVGPFGALAVAAMPLVVLRARRWARAAGYAEWSGLVAVRTGWLNREWAFTEVPKLQTLRLTASPFDRRYGMATVWLDTAGASTRDGVLRIPYLPADEARVLYERLSAGMDARSRPAE